MRVVEANELVAAWIVQGERITQPMWPFRRRLPAFDLELDPVALFEVVDAAIERQQELKCVVIGRRGRLPYHVMIR